MKTELQNRLQASDYADRWYVEGPNRRNELSAWAGIYLKPVPQEEQIMLYPEISQMRPQGDYRLAYGVHWSKIHEDKFDTDAVKALTARLNQLEFATTGWWPGVYYLDIWLRREKFLLGMANETETFIKETADIIWNVFVGNEPRLGRGVLHCLGPGCTGCRRRCKGYHQDRVEIGNQDYVG